MPVYEYVCSACGHRTDILHGINESGPNFCPECGTEGSMRKAFAPPAIVFKGSGWAKKDRSSTARASSASSANKDGESTDKSAKPESGDSRTASKTEGGSGSPSGTSRSTDGGGTSTPGKAAAAD